MGFGRGGLTEFISPTSKLEVIGELSVNEWNGVRKPQIIIQDMRVAELQVFDWRGVNRLQHKLGELDSARASANRFMSKRSDPQRAIIVERVLHWERDRKLLEATDWLLYGWDELEGAVPLNDAAAHVPIVDVTDLMLYSLPDTEASLYRLLATARAAERIYPVFADWNTDDFKLPGREAFKKVYTKLLHTASWPKDDQHALEQFARQTGLSPAIIRFILLVFEELSLVESIGSIQRTVVSPGKTELESADAYKRRLHRIGMEQSMIYSSAQELTQWLLLKRQETYAMEVSV
jgi:single-stranded-DNA-specific exonuclease